MKQRIKCKKCNQERSRNAIVYLLNDVAIYEPFCYRCAKEQLIKEYHLEGKEDKINSKNIKGIAQSLEIGKMNKQMSNPKKMKKIMGSKPYKELLGELEGKK